MKANVFYSWQSDLPSNRHFIEKCIDKGVKSLNRERRLLAVLDRDTKNELGSPNIVDTVFRKIDRSKFFICDISMIGDSNHPNDNVLIELGYAIKVLGWSKIICLFDRQSGNIEELPFDVNHNRITAFDSTRDGELERISKIIYLNINNLFANGQLFNPIEDHLKKKIDYVVINILRNIINIFKFEQIVNYSAFLVELDNYSIEELSEIIGKAETLGFYYRFDYEEYQVKLEAILDKLLSCDYFINSWREAVINFIDWIDMWTHSTEAHFSPDLLIEVSPTDYRIKFMNAENPGNPPKSVILMKHIEKDKYRVAQGGFIRDISLVDKKVVLNKKYSLLIATRIRELLHSIDFWMSESGDEFILDPHYYVID